MIEKMKKISINSNFHTEFINIDHHINKYIFEEKIINSILTIFIPHTTAGITINENADPDVMSDMKIILDRMVPWTGQYAHAEGNSAAHVKTSMMGNSLQIIIEKGRMILGTWQSIYLCEFDGPRTRMIWIKEN